MLVVDECDPILNTRASLFNCNRDEDDDGKSWINQYLETSKLKMIWISNRIDGIDESTQRRFSYAQAFRVPNARQRERVWSIQTGLQKVDFIGENKMKELAETYEVSPGNIALALRDVGSMDQAAPPGQKVKFVENILRQKELLGSGKKSKAAPLVSSYSLDDLNVDFPLGKLRDTIKGFLLQAENGQTEFKNLNVLLMGPPGTGKTEFVKSLAAWCERDLLVKRTSDLLSPYVGNTEKQIASAFSEAEDRNAILFLDEADSLFIDRSEATRSWEVTQTNELLCQMENFGGVLLCATNFQDNLDIAALRRFAFKVKFSYLRPEAHESLFQRYFGKLGIPVLIASDRERLLEIRGLAPGDFKVVLQKFGFSGGATSVGLIEALEQEARSRSGRGQKPIGGLHR